MYFLIPWSFKGASQGNIRQILTYQIRSPSSGMNYTSGGRLLLNIVDLQSQHVKMVTTDEVRKAMASMYISKCDFSDLIWNLMMNANKFSMKRPCCCRNIVLMMLWGCKYCCLLETYWHPPATITTLPAYIAHYAAFTFGVLENSILWSKVGHGVNELAVLLHIGLRFHVWLGSHSWNRVKEWHSRGGLIIR